MSQTIRMFAGFAAVGFLWAALSVAAVYGQTPPTDALEVPIIKGFGTNRGYGCYMGNEILNEEKLKKFSGDKDCPDLASLLKVDFERQTLIAYYTGGDCFMRVSAKIYRSDERKKYTVRITNRWGRCRAGGSFQGWLTIEKIPADYTIDFTLLRVNQHGEEETNDFPFLESRSLESAPAASEKLETLAIDLKNCIPTYFQKSYVIRDEAAYLKAVSNGASRDYCLKNVRKIDFEKHSLLGIQINSGYCRIPRGLAYETLKDAAKKKYLLNISYLPSGERCRALSQYDLWVLVPKLPAGYEVEFKVGARFQPD